ncbi:MAG: rod shape-determining protein RodA [Gammaproteobacteria bacterium]|nr:rod shape-determining protein RodA [Gammaproteobacteria bacterium]MDH5661139.1 rod shape-determining protein RodA [Gammaproteobacteria bacterium]
MNWQSDSSSTNFREENSISAGRRFLYRFHIDLPLLIGIMLLSAMGMIVLYSAGDKSVELLNRQFIRLFIAFIIMLIVAQINPSTLKHWAPWMFGIGLLMLIAVLVLGEVGKGAQRWLNLGLFRFQPSELMKIAVPIMTAWYLAEAALPPRRKRIFIATVIVIVPTLLIAKQPDLGTSLLIASSGIFVLLLAGLGWKLIFSVITLLAASTPIFWNYLLHDYQRQRILTFLNPETDPLGSGYHIIQSTIAIGSGGLYGKGWLNGTQSHLDFLPERSTDFVFAVFSEEFGFLGVLLLLAIYIAIISRGIIIAVNAQDTFSRLVAGSLTLTFFVYVFVNIGMVSGILPVVGLPLPLISYGGTSMVTIMAAFGILMSIQTNRRLVGA